MKFTSCVQLLSSLDHLLNKCSKARANLSLLYLKRIKYMVTDYVRTRLKKIEKYAEYALEEELVKDDQSVPHLSPAEFVYAREFHR